MDLLKLYLQGDTLSVYNKIERMGATAFDRENYPNVEAVLTETMTRVSRNIDVIYAELLNEGYCFKKKIEFDFEYPILKPRSGVKRLLRKLDKAVKRSGNVPLSLKFFYEIVGSCNFAWDYEAEANILWEGADPIQICPIKDLLVELKELEDDDDFRELGISADYLHKDNISGGPPYSIEVTEEPQIDSLLLNEEHNTTFVNYLRIVMDNCGFSRIDGVKDRSDFIHYCQKVKPRLQKI